MAVAGANRPSGGGGSDPVWIGVLGSLDVRVGGTPVAMPRGSIRTLLSVLVLESGRTLRDDALIALLWGEQPPKSVLFSLRNLVARLRVLLGAHTVLRDADGYRLNSAVATTDITEFTALAAEASAEGRNDAAQAAALLDSALALVRGAAFVDLIDVHETRASVARVEEHIVAAEEHWGTMRLTAGNAGPDLARFQNFVERHPLREVGWKNLILVLVDAGRRAEALRAAQRARETLKELGLSPSPELLAAEHQALQGSGRVVRWTPGSTLLEDRRSPAMVGRRAELAALEPLPPLARICGAPGMGKTRFLAELAARERENGAAVLYVAASPRTGGARFLGEVAREFRAADSTEAALTPAMQALLADDGAESALFHPVMEVRDARLRGATIELIDRVLARDQVLLILDDVHLLDVEAARTILDVLGAPRRGLSVVFALTPPEGGVSTALERLGRELRVGRSIELVEFGRDDALALIAPGTADAIDPELIDDIVALGKGNPALVLEAVRQFARVGVSLTRNARLDDIVLEDLHRRGIDERKTLAVLAIVGGPVPADLIAEATEHSLVETSRVLDELVASRVVEFSLREGYSLRLALVAGLIPATLPAGTLGRLRERLVMALRGRPQLVQLLVEQLLQSFDGGDAAIAELTSAIHPVLRSCIDRVDYGTALRIGERYLELVGLLNQHPDALRAQLMIATAMLARGDVNQGKTLLDLVAERAANTGDAALHADALLALGPVQTGSEHSSTIAEAAEQVLAKLDPTDHARRVQLATWAAHHRINRGERGSAVRLVEAVTGVAASAPLPTWRSLVLLTAAQAEFAVDGSPASARSRADDLRAWASLTHDETAEAGSAVFNLSLGFLDGALQDVELARDAVVQCSVRLPRSDLRWIPHAIDAAIAVARGDVEDATRLIADAESAGQRLNAAAAPPLAMLHRALLARLDGSYGRLAPFLEPSSDPVQRRHDLVAMWGLACVDGEDAAGVQRAASILKDRRTLLNGCGLVWPIVAMAVGELAWRARDAELGDRLWEELRHWSGHGLSVLGMAYAGAADTWLGAAAAASGRKKAAVALLASAAQQEARRGTIPWRVRAEQLLEEVSGSGEAHRT